MTLKEAQALVEAILFVSGEPVPTRELCKCLGFDAPTMEALIRGVAALYQGDGRGVRLLEIGGGWQFCSVPELAPTIAAYVGDRRSARLSQAALETLAIVAYRQPVTKGEIEQIRGVNVDGVVGALVDRELITEVGRRDTVGRPILYGVTPKFLRHFGLSCIAELPRLEDLDGSEPGSIFDFPAEV